MFLIKSKNSGNRKIKRTCFLGKKNTQKKPNNKNKTKNLAEEPWRELNLTWT